MAHLPHALPPLTTSRQLSVRTGFGWQLIEAINRIITIILSLLKLKKQRILSGRKLRVDLG